MTASRASRASRLSPQAHSGPRWKLVCHRYLAAVGREMETRVAPAQGRSTHWPGRARCRTAQRARAHTVPPGAIGSRARRNGGEGTRADQGGAAPHAADSKEAAGLANQGRGPALLEGTVVSERACVCVFLSASSRRCLVGRSTLRHLGGGRGLEMPRPPELVMNLPARGRVTPRRQSCCFSAPDGRGYPAATLESASRPRSSILGDVAAASASPNRARDGAQL